MKTAAAVIVLALLPALSSASEVESVPKGAVATMIRKSSDTWRLVLIYSSYCPACRSMFPEFVRLAKEWQDRGGTALAFSLDEDNQTLADYLLPFRVSFTPYRLRWCPPGERRESLKAAGIKVESTFSIPLFAVFRPGESVASQWNGSNAVGWIQSRLTELGPARPDSPTASKSPTSSGANAESECEGDRGLLSVTATGADNCKVFVGSPLSMNYAALGTAPFSQAKAPRGRCHLVIECAGGLRYEKAIKLPPGEPVEVVVRSGDWLTAEPAP